jgi:hypothetical protein
MLKLQWEDVNLKDRAITVKKSYWMGKKKAPPYVPISRNLYHHLSVYSNMLSGKTPTDRLFPYTESGCETYWDRIIERTTLFKMVLKNGAERKDYINIHALRHTCQTRYKQKPYRIPTDDCGWLLGHTSGSPTQIRYDHFTDQRHRETCDDLRKAIDQGDIALAKQLKNEKKRRTDMDASVDMFHDSMAEQYGRHFLDDREIELFKDMMSNLPEDITSASFHPPQEQATKFKPRKPRIKKMKLKPIDPNVQA